MRSSSFDSGQTFDNTQAWGGPATVGLFHARSGSLARSLGADTRGSRQHDGRRRQKPGSAAFVSHCRADHDDAPGTHVGRAARSRHALSYRHYRGELGARSLCPMEIRTSTVRHVRGNTCWTTTRIRRATVRRHCETRRDVAMLRRYPLENIWR